MGFLGRSYRTYALDFWGFGESGKKRETYAVQDFVGLVNQFMEQLGISQAPLVGHSMGGTVSLAMAVQYPQRCAQRLSWWGHPSWGHPRISTKAGGLQGNRFFALQHDVGFPIDHENR